MYKFVENKLKVFIVHPGGPFWKNKDLGVWSIPKGEINDGENDLSRAIKEVNEETGIKLPKEKERYIFLGEVKQKSWKKILAWAIEDKENFWKGILMKQNFIEIKDNFTGKKIKIPEVDKADYFEIKKAKEKLISGQDEFIDRLIKKLVCYSFFSSLGVSLSFFSSTFSSALTSFTASPLLFCSWKISESFFFPSLTIFKLI